MHLSGFFRSYYTWLDHQAVQLDTHPNAEVLQCFLHQAALLLACEHDILRRALLDNLFGEVDEVRRAQLYDNRKRLRLEQQLARLPRARSAVVFRVELGLVRDALALAGQRAESWARFAEAVLTDRDVDTIDARIGRAHEVCSAVDSAPGHALRVDVLH